jgi:CheY-like chemotaxis protein
VSAPAPEAPLVLVADNDGGVNDLLREVLSRVGLRTAAVADGAAALQVIAAGGVALLVCDLDMPKLGGSDVLAELARSPDPPPVLVVSGYLDAHTERALTAHRHVRGVFRKPFDVFAFAEAARRIVAPEREVESAS